MAEQLVQVHAEDNDTQASALARRRLDRFMKILTAALADDDVSERVCRAGISVRIELKDLPDTFVTLALDAPPARALYGTHGISPDVRLWMWSADLEAILAQRSYLPLQILAGEVEFEGYVRKLLRVLPILTDATASQARRD